MWWSVSSSGVQNEIGIGVSLVITNEWKWTENSSVYNTSQTKYGLSTSGIRMSIIKPNVGRISVESNTTTDPSMYLVPCTCIHFTLYEC